MIDEIVRSFSRTLEYLRRLLADVPDELLTFQPGGVMNHPAWVIGHLTHSFQAIGSELGITRWLPVNWEQQFGTGSVPVEIRDAYPCKDELLNALADGQLRVVKRLHQIGEEGLGEPLPDDRYRDMFPTLGHAVLHILTSHVAVHVGQVTVWRRAAGLEPLPEPFI
jgi:uncharacterized damage-inducible protein DinB